MRHRNAGETSGAGIAQHGEGSLGKLALGEAGEIAVQGIEPGQCSLV